MTEDVNVSKILDIANKYSLKVADYQFSPKFDVKLSCGLLVARVKYAVYNDLVENIEMPQGYTSLSGDDGHRYILCQGWMQAQGLFSFERKVKFLLENFKRCEVECRKLELENDFK
jgi:hypothetical protein